MYIEKSYKCSECGRTFHKKKSLELHKERHINWTNPYPEGVEV